MDEAVINSENINVVHFNFLKHVFFINKYE